MILGIIGAMDQEVEKLKENMEVIETKQIASRKFYKGWLWGKNVVVVTCGIGKVNAASCTQILADVFRVTHIINVGIAGGLKKEICPGDVVIATDLIQHDMDVTDYNYERGQIPRMECWKFQCDENLVETAISACKNLTSHNHFKGRIVSGDEFVNSDEKSKFLQEHFDASACEMEGASIAHVSYLNSIPFVIIRSISDNANSKAKMDYEEFESIAILNSFNIIFNMLKKL